MLPYLGLGVSIALIVAAFLVGRHIDLMLWNEQIKYRGEVE